MGSKSTTANFLFCPRFKYFFVYRTLSMRQKTQNHRNQGSIDKKNSIFFAVPKSHTQMGSLSAKNAIEKFSCLGTFKTGKVLHRSNQMYELKHFGMVWQRRT
jgi:hypothetical protein